MSLRISGKNLDIGDALREQVDGRIAQIVGKYFDGGFNGHVTVEREGSAFRADCALHLDTGVVLHSEGRAHDAHQSFEAAAERIEKRLRRYKRRLKGHPSRRSDATPATAYVIEAPDEEGEVETDFAPVIIAEEPTHLPTMTVAEAVLELDLVGTPAIAFRNAGHKGINVVYRRNDGNIGWIDPSLDRSEGSSGS